MEGNMIFNNTERAGEKPAFRHWYIYARLIPMTWKRIRKGRPLSRSTPMTKELSR